MQEESILRDLKAGDVHVYEQLVHLYSRYVATIVHRVGDGQLTAQDIEEVSADVFIKLWQQRDHIDVSGDKLKSYIGVMARNHTLNRLRGKGVSIIPLEEDMIDYQTPENTLVEEEERVLVHQVIEILPEPDREIFIRRYFYMERVQEIASRLGLNVQTVGTKLFRGRKKLERHLRERGIVHE
ncbi:MAG: RNA polymerase sigma factor [Cellulosilyticaceae bacterium]